MPLLTDEISIGEVVAATRHCKCWKVCYILSLGLIGFRSHRTPDTSLHLAWATFTVLYTPVSCVFVLSTRSPCPLNWSLHNSNSCFTFSLDVSQSRISTPLVYFHAYSPNIYNTCDQGYWRDDGNKRHKAFAC